MKLIPQNKIDEAAREHYRMGQLGLEKAADTEHAFHKGVQFALNEIQPLMIEFKDWCDINERDLRLENISNMNSSAITTEQLLEEFIKRNNKKDE